MSKTKLRRLTDEEQENISAFKEAVKNEIEKSNPFNGFSFEKNHTKNNYKINAIIDYGDFKAIIFYNPCFIISDIIDVEFDLGAKYKYNIYSIFNFFEIDDYTQYYFSDVLENTTFEECVHFIFEMINKYSFEIKKACEPINLSRLEELVLQDYKNEYKKKSDDEISKIRLDEFSIDVVHPFFSDASDSGNTQKLLNKLEKKNEKGKLETLYEKRLLKFLQSGNEIQNELTVKNNKNRKAYIKLMAKVFGLEVIIPIILAVGSVVYNLCYLYSGAYLLGGNNTGKVIFYFLYSKILLIIGLIFFMTVGLNGLFSKMLTKKLSNNDPAIMRRYETNNSDKIFAVKSLQKFSKPVKIIISCILLFVSIIAASIIAEDNIGFYDSYVKFYSADTLSVCSVDYEDMKIVRVLGYYDDETDDYIEYTDVESYIVAGSDGSDYYVIENILPNGSTDKYIKDLAYKYSIEIDECKSAEDYSESLEFVGEN